MHDDSYEVSLERRPSPGIAAVLSVLLPGLLIHALSVWAADRSARAWRGY